ncbi:MAG: NAD(P)H-hydrate dehydratase, partial [Planctomycetaceae bacterium]|nr:NAD(P)H-hydrate dehydratase [Planctomycetaceae bacterium]
LAGRAALTTGAGLVKCAVPGTVLPTVAALSMEMMTAPLPEDRFGRISLDAYREILRLGEAATVVALGPGLGRSLGLTALVAKLYREIAKPMIVDADALNALAERKFDKTAFPRILTPHSGEFARLLGRPIPKESPSTQQERIELACDFAKRTDTITLLKGHETIITDGKTAEINQTGNPGMATGGSGDVLTGIIAGLVAQRLSPWEAAVSGAYLHGRAGDLAAEKLGQESLTAGAMIDSLHYVEIGMTIYS